MPIEITKRPCPTSGHGVRVAIIDSGVHAEHPHVCGVSGGIAVDDDGGYTQDFVDRIGHGTAVTAAIKEKAPEAECHAVRIFSERLTARAATVIAGMEWAIAHGMHVINLSLGTTNQVHAAAFRATVVRANAARVLIVAAQDDAERCWLPGGLPGVIAVRADWECPRHQLRVIESDSGTVFLTSGFARPIDGVDPWRNLHGSSFAVASVTGMLCRLLTDRRRATFEQASWWLRSLAEPNAERAVSDGSRPTMSVVRRDG